MPWETEKGLRSLCGNIIPTPTLQTAEEPPALSLEETTLGANLGDWRLGIQEFSEREALRCSEWINGQLSLCLYDLSLILLAELPGLIRANPRLARN